MTQREGTDPGTACPELATTGSHYIWPAAPKEAINSWVLELYKGEKSELVIGSWETQQADEMTDINTRGHLTLRLTYNIENNGYGKYKCVVWSDEHCKLLKRQWQGCRCVCESLCDLECTLPPLS